VNASKWILLVEDDGPLAELTLLALTLQDPACEVVVAEDGLEALDCIHHSGKFQTRVSGDPAFVLLDLKMPKMDGLEVLRQIKSDARLKAIPVIMFTSSHEPTDVSRSYELGANAFVVKPMDSVEFNDRLKQIGTFWTKVNMVPSAVSPIES